MCGVSSHVPTVLCTNRFLLSALHQLPRFLWIRRSQRSSNASYSVFSFEQRHQHRS